MSTYMYNFILYIMLLWYVLFSAFKAAFMLILRRQNQRFETLIQNADPKPR